MDIRTIRLWMLVWLMVDYGISGIFAEYKGLYTTNIQEAHETIPQKIVPHVSHDLTTFHTDSDQVHFNVSIYGTHHILILKPSKVFISPSLVVEKRKKGSRTRGTPSMEASNCHFQGTIQGHPNSKVAISACNGLTGLMYTSRGKYYIEPSHHPHKRIDPGHKHLIFKRSAVISSYPKEKHKSRKRKQLNCGTKDPKKMTLLEWQQHLHKKHSKIQKSSRLKEKGKHKKLYSNHTMSNKVSFKKKRSISEEYFVEALVVGDQSMVEFHQNEETETYILTLMNMVSSLFLDPTIGNSINIVVVKIILIDDSLTEPNLNVSINADESLKTFCKWQIPLNPREDSHPHHHDVAVLITRKDICSNQNTPCGTLGVAYIGGMCTPSKSCSVNEDNGISSAHTIAHEIGHNFGMLHDAEKTGCKPKEGIITHLMTPNFEASTVTVQWSNCSRRDITRFLDKGHGQCLRDKPSSFEKYPVLPPGVIYDVNYQCRLQFGINATVCHMEEICQRLWCNVNDTCTSMLKPAAPGTRCKKHMWCQLRQCLPVRDPPSVLDGGWSMWSSWSDCSRTCGAGVSLSSRKCDRPTPAGGGKYCLGERDRYRICNTQPCPKGKPTFREWQCSRFDKVEYEGKKYKWRPYFHMGDPCQLYCSDANETVIALLENYVLDGTPCSVVSRDMCISGVCQKVGCDWVINSQAKEDECGICKGDGTKCIKQEGVYLKQNKSPGYREVVFIPKDARNIRIEEKGYSKNYISIGSAFVKKFFLNGDKRIALSGEYIVAGTPALYERENHLEKIVIPGPIKEPIVVYIYFRGKMLNPGVEYQYSIWKPEKTKQLEYSWTLSDWSACTATCGGGVQTKKPICEELTISPVTSDLEAPRSVDHYMCEPEDKPDKVMRTCNVEPCPNHWWTGPWQACPVTCAVEGKLAMKHRTLMCVDEQNIALPNSFCNRTNKPIEYQLCDELPDCTEDW